MAPDSLWITSILRGSIGLMDSAERMKHLEMIQAVISRLANNSFTIKGWGLTVVSAMFALGAAKDGNPRMLIVALIPALAFGLLDAYYLWLERIWRGHYSRVRLAPDDYPFDMKINDLKKIEHPLETLLRPAIWGFWGPVIAACVAGWRTL